MYCLTIRKSCKVEKILCKIQMSYGVIIDATTYKTVFKVYGFDVEEIAVIADCVDIRKKVLING